MDLTLQVSESIVAVTLFMGWILCLIFIAYKWSTK